MGDLRTDRTFTGQKRDATGLLYYNARYYDPNLGAFISPDTIVPNMGRVIDYNRFLYARGNPLKYTDPSGHASAASIREWEYKNSWYNAHGYFWDGSHWSKKGAPVIKTRQNATDVLDTAGIKPDKNFADDELIKLAKGISAFAKKIEEIPNHRKVNGLKQIDNLIEEDVEWRRKEKGSLLCAINAPPACAWNDGVEFYDALFDGSHTDEQIAAVAVHEMAHEIHFEPVFQSKCGNGGPRCDIAKQAGEFLDNNYILTDYAQGLTWGVEYWAEAVGVWVFGKDYPGLNVDITKPHIRDVFDCPNFTESYWQEFRFGVDSPDEVIETAIRLWGINREQFTLSESSRDDVLYVRWEDSQGERVYSARFREGEFHQVLVRFQSGRKPTLSQVIDCLGSPEYYAAYVYLDGANKGFALSLSYPEKGFDIRHSSYTSLPKSTMDLPARLIDTLIVVAPGPLEQMVRDVYSYGHRPSVHAWGLCVLRPWPGSIEATEIESFLDEDRRCKYPY